MKRIIMMVLRNILLVPWMWAKLCYHASHVDKYTEEEHYRMLQFITHRANKGGNVIGAYLCDESFKLRFGQYTLKDGD